MFYSIAHREGEDHPTLAVFLSDGTSETIADTHPHWERLVQHLTSAEPNDEELVARLLAPAKVAGAALAEITDRVEYRNNNLFLDGEPVNDGLGRYILARIEEGTDDWQPFVRFLLLLDDNPSMQSRRHLFTFIESNGLTLTEDGHILAYKGVRYDGTSVTSGPHVSVNGVPLEGSQHVPNEVGAVISIPRSKVDDNRAQGCSHGLHVGAYTYALNFGQRLLRVKVNPAHVVSVPEDCHDQKMRVEQYTVVEESNDEVVGTVYRVVTESDAVEQIEESEDAPGMYDEPDEGLDFGYGNDEPDAQTLADADDALALLDDEDEPDIRLGTIANLADAAAVIPSVRLILNNTDLGHKAAAAAVNVQAEDFGADFATTESSVRRWRKHNGVTLS